MNDHSRGVEGFEAGLRACGLSPERRGNVVVFPVVAVVGRLAGQTIESGVLVDELSPWPHTPPHWVQLPLTVKFAHTNTQESPIPGWAAHSRDVKGWAACDEPAQAWIAHVRSVLSAAV